MWLYDLLKTMSTVISWLPYKAVVVIGKGIGHLYHKIAKKQRVRAEETIRERLGYSQEQADQAAGGELDDCQANRVVALREHPDQQYMQPPDKGASQL